MKLRTGFYRHCGCPRTFNQRESVRNGVAHPYLECRTCARHQTDRKRKPFVKLTQRMLFQ